MHDRDAVERFVVVTGGPGSGKTAVRDRLRPGGIATTVEAGRGIIQDHVALGGHALPWADRELFAELMLSWDMRSYREAQRRQLPQRQRVALPSGNGVYFVDRVAIEKYHHAATVMEAVAHFIFGGGMAG